MFGNVLAKVFGSRNQRVVKQLSKRIARINGLEAEIEKLSDDELKQSTEKFKKRLAEGETLDGLLEEAFAVVREVGKRQLNMRHFDVQLVGGMVLHQGKVAEMRTGEGKTLVADVTTLQCFGPNGWRCFVRARQ